MKDYGTIFIGLTQFHSRIGQQPHCSIHMKINVGRAKSTGAQRNAVCCQIHISGYINRSGQFITQFAGRNDGQAFGVAGTCKLQIIAVGDEDISGRMKRHTVEMNLVAVMMPQRNRVCFKDGMLFNIQTRSFRIAERAVNIQIQRPSRNRTGKLQIAVLLNGNVPG